ncbi:two-component system nitrogen regulation sensor histidine kinase GlnL [Lysobacter niabensis]|uniref:histidine kinase n=1 Tax=Agrilutibacter niabensis TaxID=380628 RepID=A0ABU1VS25_9GAMM|nr:ATP-binding protein [Lysobacter niabensis]MDR7100289.1 two-component system nitrogen regulation sensor histidine kinase GlnL [Lysobacter niabensis]
MTAPAPDSNSLTTPLAWADAAGVILGANPALARWLGVSSRRLPGVPLAALEVDGEMLARALAESGETPRDFARLRRLALAFPGHDEPRFADVSLSRTEAGWLVEAHPVEEFPGEDPAVALPSALSAALKGLAHELRNPLAGLKGAAQLLARRIASSSEDDRDSRELVALIEAEVARLTALLERLLSPTPARPHEPLNIHAVLERVLRLAEADAGWAVKLTRDYDPSLPELTGDADRLTQAVWNLVRNAIEAGAVNVTLRTRAEHAARIGDEPHALALRLEISDDGRGVPEELAERLFLPLVSGRAEGSGLGLALAQQVAREHRGSLVYRSRPGHTVFTVLLPIALEGDTHEGNPHGA